MDSKPVRKAGRKKTAGAKVAKKTTARKKAATKKAAKKAAGKKAAEAVHVVVARRQSIKNIRDLYDHLKTALGTEQDVVVDASQVESIDTASLQMLIAFANTMRGNAHKVEWKEPSAEFRALAELADLHRHCRIGEAPAVEAEDGLCPVF